MVSAEAFKAAADLLDSADLSSEAELRELLENQLAEESQHEVCLIRRSCAALSRDRVCACAGGCEATNCSQGPAGPGTEAPQGGMFVCGVCARMC